MIKILIVDDSPFSRRILSQILSSDEGMQIVGEARNGKEALEKIPTLKPDLITLDIHMPVMDGIATLENINRLYKIPVIVVSSFTKEDADLTLKALDKGAIDFVTKPRNIFDLKERAVLSNIIEKVKMAVKSNVNIKYDIIEPGIQYPLDSFNNTTGFKYIVAIGASTGGPKALQSILPLLSKDINAAIVIVQHMPPKFTRSLADRLNGLSEIRIKEGEEGELLKRGYCYIAPGDYYMEVIGQYPDYYIQLTKRLATVGLNTSIDILMQSISRLKKIKKIGIIMTGMGSDGSNGIIQIKKSAGFTIVQDEESSVVFGMPKSAIDTGGIDKIVPLNNIAHEIMSKVGV